MACATTYILSPWIFATGADCSISTGARFAIPGQDGFSRAIVDSDHNNVGPRVGFAYQMRRRWVVRGGYGLFYGLRDQNQEVTQIAGNNPNTPALVAPVVSAQRTVTPPYTIKYSQVTLYWFTIKGTIIIGSHDLATTARLGSEDVSVLPFQ